MSSARSRIHSTRDYERFLRQRGFSRREAKILASPYKELAANEQDASQMRRAAGSPEVTS